MAKKKNEAAVALGALGGKARAKKLTDEERSEAARKAVKARWGKTTAEERSEYARKIGKASGKARKKK